jgi:hypothetical protein
MVRRDLRRDMEAGEQHLVSDVDRGTHHDIAFTLYHPGR